MEVSSAVLRGIWPTFPIVNEKVFISSLYKVRCECTRACIEELIFFTEFYVWHKRLSSKKVGNNSV